MEKGRVRDAISSRVSRKLDIAWTTGCCHGRLRHSSVERAERVFLGCAGPACVLYRFRVPFRGDYVAVGEAIFDLPALKAGESAGTGTIKTLSLISRRERPRTVCRSELATTAAHAFRSLAWRSSAIYLTAAIVGIPARSDLQPKTRLFHNSYSRLAGLGNRPSPLRPICARALLGPRHTSDATPRSHSS